MSEFEQNDRNIVAASARERRLQARIDELQAEVAVFASRNELMMECYASMWAQQMGSFSGRWTQMDERINVVNFVERWTELSGVSRLRLLGWLDISESKFFNWKRQVLLLQQDSDASDLHDELDDIDLAAQ